MRIRFKHALNYSLKCTSVLAAVVVVLAVPRAQAAKRTWQEHVARGKAALAGADLHTAGVEFETAVSMLEGQSNKRMTMASVQAQLADLYLMQKKPDLCRASTEKQLELIEGFLPADHQVSLDAQMRLAMAYASEKNDTEAVKLLSKYLPKRRKLALTLPFATVLRVAGQVYARTGHNEDALSCYLQSIQIKKRLQRDCLDERSLLCQLLMVMKDKKTGAVCDQWYSEYRAQNGKVKTRVFVSDEPLIMAAIALRVGKKKIALALAGDQLAYLKKQVVVAKPRLARAYHVQVMILGEMGESNLQERALQKALELLEPKEKYALERLPILTTAVASEIKFGKIALAKSRAREALALASGLDPGNPVVKESTCALGALKTQFHLDEP